uniref:Rho guanine nucleotide exchange factor 11 n=1 Tax=Steinernema glaseri TaxID=37863 RepID=A0A1I7Z2X7_9BILA
MSLREGFPLIPTVASSSGDYEVPRSFVVGKRTNEPTLVTQYAPVPVPSGGHDSQLIRRCVVVTKHEDGYGLTVTGDNPVYVHTVKPDGAAFRAGVREGDRIVKVNGMPVTSANHLEVVRMISCGQNVALTLEGRPLEPQTFSASSHYSQIDSDSESTAHLDSSQRKQVQAINKMLNDQRRHVESLKEKSNDEAKLEKALQRIETLQSQLKKIDANAYKSGVFPTPVQSWVDSGHMNFLQPLDVVPMEEDTDDEDNECSLPLDADGPFASFADLKGHPAHLAVFISFLLTNANPSTLLFYLITDVYQNQNSSGKELRRWAYEIFSTFVIPNSPMQMPNMDQSLVQNIDNELSATADGGDVHIDRLKRLFVAVKRRALDDINEHLADFRHKRHLGLGSLFDGSQLDQLSKGEPLMERRVAEQMLFRALERMIAATNGDLELCEPRSAALIMSLATVIKVVLGMKPNLSSWEKLLEKCPSFVTCNKVGVFKSKSVVGKRSIQLKSHQFHLSAVNSTVYCYQCRDAVWGVNAQAYFCQSCEVVLHKQCTGQLVDVCFPATQSKGGKQMIAKSKKAASGPTYSTPEDVSAESTEKTKITAMTLEKHMDLPTTAHTLPSSSKANVKSTSSDSGIGVDVPDKIVSRSHSMRSKEKDCKTMCRLELISTAEADKEESPFAPSDVASVSGSSSVSRVGEEEAQQLLDRLEKTALADGDSDLEVETEVPTLDSLIGWEVVRHLKPKEKRRQEVINELFHTERTHVRNLKVLYTVFCKPMLQQQIVGGETINLLFANLDELVEIHSDISRKMRDATEAWRRAGTQQGLYGQIGKLMVDIFDGEAGQRFVEATSKFCQHQQHALDLLRHRCKKDRDDQLVKFLSEVESNPLCRKLQLKDMLPVEMQRLVKYPLLLETIAKYTPEPSEEQDLLLCSVTASRRILSMVNLAKRNAENLRRLEELQKKLDTSPYDKDRSDAEFNSFDLKNYRLVHDGSLTWRFSRGKMVELHVVLLENLLVLLTKQGDGHKLQLKIQEPSKDSRWSPILKLDQIIAKEKANDKRTFFVIDNASYAPQIYELTAATATERKTWFKLISDQIECARKENNVDENGQLIAGGCGLEGGGSGSGSNMGGSELSGPQRVHVLTHPRLVNANEITIQQPTVLEHAQPILTPTEKLRRNDQLIIKSLAEKHTILCQYLLQDQEGSQDLLEKITETMTGMPVAELKKRDCRELAMSAIVHGNRLLDSINQGMSVKIENENTSSMKVVLDENAMERNLPSVPCYRLTSIAAPLMNHLKAMMQVLIDQQNEITSIKQQLYHYKELAEDGPGNRTALPLVTNTREQGKLLMKRQLDPGTVLREEPSPR